MIVEKEDCGRVASLDERALRDLVRRALDEDLGAGGDITTDAIVPDGAVASGRLVSRQEGILAGIEVALATFRALDPDCRLVSMAADGAELRRGQPVLELIGRAAALLTAERVALNFVGHLSGVATTTRRLVDAVAGTRAVVTCTRKTTPGLRALEKHAVRCGGGENHRFTLDEAVLVKDNHVELAGGVAAAIDRVRERLGPSVRVEVEVESLADLEAALAAGADSILLDNMSPGAIRKAVARCAGAVPLEASGGVTLETIRVLAETGVDRISVGALTHSAPALDVSMEISPR